MRFMFRAHAQRRLDEPSHSHSIPWWPRHASDQREAKLGELGADVEPGPELKKGAFDDRNEDAFDIPAPSAELARACPLAPPRPLAPPGPLAPPRPAPPAAPAPLVWANVALHEAKGGGRAAATASMSLPSPLRPAAGRWRLLCLKGAGSEGASSELARATPPPPPPPRPPPMPPPPPPPPPP